MNQQQKQATDELIQKLEGFKSKPYPDSKGVATTGYGTTFYPNGKAVTLRDPDCTREQAIEWLNYHLDRFVCPDVDKLQEQYKFNDKVYAALCSFAYNEGKGNLYGNSIIDALKSGKLKDLESAFMLYDKITVDGKKVVCPGLVNRRKAEVAYFMEK